MNYVKIDVRGYEHFNDDLGGVPFEKGISTRPLTPNEIARLGASIRLVIVDSDEQVGPGVDIVNAIKANSPAEVVKPLRTAEEARTEAIEPLEYDRDRLEAIASEGGIKAIREVAAKFGVKGVQISQLIDNIIKVQEDKIKENLNQQEG